MLRSEFRRVLLLIAVGLSLAGCSITSEEALSALAEGKGRLTSDAWLPDVGGKIEGTKLHKNLGYPAAITSPQVSASYQYGPHEFDAEWTRLSFSGSRPGFTFFGGYPVFAGGELSTSLRIAPIQAAYGYRMLFEEGRFVLTPLVGAMLVDSTFVLNSREPKLPKRFRKIFPSFSGRVIGDDEGGPIIGLNGYARIWEWLGFDTRVTGAEIPSVGSFVDARTAAKVRFYHVECNIGYRFAEFDAAHTSLQFRGPFFGLGAFF